jgi:hypothetical protein
MTVNSALKEVFCEATVLRQPRDAPDFCILQQGRFNFTERWIDLHWMFFRFLDTLNDKTI